MADDLRSWASKTPYQLGMNDIADWITELMPRERASKLVMLRSLPPPPPMHSGSPGVQHSIAPTALLKRSNQPNYLSKAPANSQTPPKPETTVEPTQDRFGMLKRVAGAIAIFLLGAVTFRLIPLQQPELDVAAAAAPELVPPVAGPSEVAPAKPSPPVVETQPAPPPKPQQAEQTASAQPKVEAETEKPTEVSLADPLETSEPTPSTQKVRTETQAPPKRPPAAAPDRSSAKATNAPAKTHEARRSGKSGSVRVVGIGGWATVVHRGKTLGNTPIKAKLPVGAQVLVLRPNGTGKPKKVRVNITADEIQFLRVPLID